MIVKAPGADCMSPVLILYPGNKDILKSRVPGNNDPALFHYSLLLRINSAMKPIVLFVLFTVSNLLSCRSQPAAEAAGGMPAKALGFLATLSKQQRSKAQFSFDREERYNWHYVPKTRKGISLEELNASQRKAAQDLLATALSDTGFQKTTAIIALEAILREAEGRPVDDSYRDPGEYYFSIFGDPADSIWGWRLEGHHISLNFSSENNRLVSGTPGFLGANPAIVLSGPEKGKQILKDETAQGFALLQSLDETQKQKAIFASQAPSDILTAASRKAMLDPAGIMYSELNASQQAVFLRLLSVYIHRYTRLFAMDMMNEIETAGLNKLRFAWAGAQQAGPGNRHYYRIQGPTIIIEYDNTQNNANHVHTVIRELNNDFGGDELLEHYRKINH